MAPANNPRIAMYSARMPDVAAPRAHRAAAARTDTSSAPGGTTAQVGPAAPAVAPAIVAVPPTSELAAAARMAGSMLINMLSPGWRSCFLQSKAGSDYRRALISGSPHCTPKFADLTETVDSEGYS